MSKTSICPTVYRIFLPHPYDLKSYALLGFIFIFLKKATIKKIVQYFFENQRVVPYKFFENLKVVVAFRKFNCRKGYSLIIDRSPLESVGMS